MSSAGRRHWRIYNNTQWFGIGLVVMYGLNTINRTNPLESMPIYRQRYYAIIAQFKVDYTDHKDFEFFTKDTIRYYQQHSGYLFSHLIRGRDYSSGRINYFLVQTWANMSAFKVAFDTPYRDELTRVAKPINGYTPQVFKIVADDFEFIPPATRRNPGLERQGLRKAIDINFEQQKSPSYTAQKYGTRW